MNREQVNNTIVEYLSKYSFNGIGIFGSYARGENTVTSDLDILIQADNTISLLQLVRIERELSEKLGIKVDIVTTNALKNKHLKEHIKKDLQVIYGNPVID